MDSKFLKLYRDLNAFVAEKEKARYFLHTSVGVVEIGRIYAREGRVCIDGMDEGRVMRFYCFSEEQITSFPLEVRGRRGTKRKHLLGFRTDPESAIDGQESR